MKMRIILSPALVIALAFVSGCATNASTFDQMKPMTADEHQQMLNK